MTPSECKRRGHNYIFLTVDSPGSPSDGIEAGPVKLRVCLTCLRIPQTVHLTDGQ